MPESLHIRNVSKHYGDDILVLKEINETFHPGEMVGIIGPNGSGKTTLLRVLTAAAYPSSGSVKYGDLDIHEHPHDYLNATGIVFDLADVPAFVTAAEWLQYILRAKNAWTPDSPNLISDLLDEVQLDERRNRLAGTYSSGMLKKTQIAAALVANPSILLLDEPLRGLDTDALTAVSRLFQQRAKDGSVIIIASHMQAQLDPLCNRYVRLGDRLPASQRTIAG